MDAIVNVREKIAEEIERAIDRAEGRPTEWGADDCMLWVANILRDALGADPAEPFRGRYWTERTALQVIGKGGLPAAVRRQCRALGWPGIRKIDRAEFGDIGVARNATTGAHSCVLRYNADRSGRGFWIGRANRGIALVPDALVGVAWRVA